MTDPRPTRAMVLAAGLGTRLRPLTDELPKPLAPVLNRPLVEHVLGRLADAGVTLACLNTHHLPGAMEAWAAARTGGPEVVLRHEPEILGTAGGIAGAADLLSTEPSFLLHNGDVWCDADLGRLADDHAASGAEITLLTVDHPRINSVRVGADGRVRDVAGLRGATAAQGDRARTYTGVAAVARRFLERLPAGRSELATALVAALDDDPGSVRTHEQPEATWSDLGTPASYLEAHAELLAVGERILAGEGAVVDAGAELRGFAVLGAGCRIGADVRLEDCIVMPGAQVAGPADLHRCVVGRGWVMPAHAEAPAPVPDRLADLLGGQGFGRPADAVPLSGQASDRRFWRVRGADATAVLMDSSADPSEFDRTVAISAFLHEHDLGGAAVLAVDSDRHAAVFEDLGDTTLGAALAARPAEALSLYVPVLDLLADLQHRGADLVRGGACPEAGDRVFGVDDLLAETAYFARRCLVQTFGRPVGEVDALAGEFRALAETVAADPVVPMHRDFQSTNVMIHAGRPRLVDVQGMRWGPPGYDAASLLRDPYVDLDPETVAALIQHWTRSAAARTGDDPEHHRRAFVLAGLQRNMQALGAYCFLSRIRGKGSFRRFIEPGLDRLADGLGDLAVLADAPSLPGLSRIVREIKK